MKTLLTLLLLSTLSAPAVVVITSSTEEVEADVQVVEVTVTPPPVEVFTEPFYPQYVAPEPAPPAYTPPEDALCPEWHETAMEAGIPEEDLKRWDYIIWRESRCLTDAHNTYDPMSGSRGLTQVNGFWCRPSRYFPNGWLQDQGIVANCDDLYDPLTNFLAARAIWEYSEDRNGCGWLPWTTRKTRWCS